MLNAALHAFVIVMDPMRLLTMLGGVILGLALGVVPGLGGIVGLALLIPFTYHIDGYTAFALLLGMAAVTTVSDLIPAVLFGVPGTVGAAATVIDGHQMARKGQAARAFGAGYMSSLSGGIFGALLLALLLPFLRTLVMYVGSAELLAFCIFGLSMIAVLSGKAPLKGLAVASFGLMLSLVGSDPQTGTLRWTFGSFYLWDHLPLVPVALGIFAIPELADMAIERTSIARHTDTPAVSGSQWDGIRDAMRHWWLVLRCSGLGAVLGAVPGVGSAVIDWMAYAHALRTEKNPESFGRGDIRGVIAAESSNNAKEGGHLIPTIAFGMPAGASMALLLSAFMMHGFTPGPEMLTKHLSVTYAIIWTLAIAHMMGAVICLLGSRLFAKLATVRVGVLLPLILAILFLGAFNASMSWGDICSLVLSGAFGWIMKRLDWPRPPLILGLVLGSMCERYYFISTEVYGTGFFTRPIVLVVLLAALWVVIGPTVRGGYRRLKNRNGADVAPRTKARWAVRRFDHRSLFAFVMMLIPAAAIWSARGWNFGARLMPMTAASAALLFCVLIFLRQLVTIEGGAVAAATSNAHDLPQHAEPVPAHLVRSRGLRFFLWITGGLALGYGIGLIPALFVLVMMLARFEFAERWRTSILMSVVASVILWAVFDRIFAVTWSPSILGNMVPALRGATGGLL
ncbi:tripartite tricarboxylate transporter permease [Paraburkholderia tagetis]|uniref:Tripartite tricarboxylate transporter permease n=1 Tax=Paraburkholderia tagetis TaxID=2913261 RepID=A0A9X1RIR6_9BURK|nr:tripartite tricarboxylate transporter permease [Paraburkholderia tagetis]MCG5071968.1 tripartite tricarboxylate transporter permease [Paraburkholderia tagetis]